MSLPKKRRDIRICLLLFKQAELAIYNFEGSIPSNLSSMPLLELVNIVDSGSTVAFAEDFCNSDLNRDIVFSCNVCNIPRLTCMRCIEDYPHSPQDES
jgi:hypothetical protein